MTEVPESARLEIKFIAYEIEIARLRSWVRGHQGAFFEVHTPRRVNNLYFDSYDYDDCAQNIAGLSERGKLRYRWYGHDALPGPGVLEKKCKRNFFGWKQRYPVAEAPYRSGQDWRATLRRLREQLPVAGRYEMDIRPLPVLINRYDREYYQLRDALVRITVDENLVIYDQRFKSLPNISRPADLPRVMILEVKGARKDQPLINHVVQGLPIRVGRFSKYVTGLRAIGGF